MLFRHEIYIPSKKKFSIDGYFLVVTGTKY